MDQDKPILFFDGHCNLCNGSIDLLVRIDSKNLVAIAPLQGKTAKAKLPAEIRESLQSMVLLDQGKIYLKSAAIFKLASIIKGPLNLLRPFWIIPRFFTDWVYNCVALTRYPLFGRRDSCRLPSAEEKQHFLD